MYLGSTIVNQHFSPPFEECFLSFFQASYDANLRNIPKLKSLDIPKKVTAGYPK